MLFACMGDLLHHQHHHLGGGNLNVFVMFTPKIAEDDFQFDLRIFVSDGVES